MRDLVREVDAKFRTIQARHMRALAGLSMGGYGALKLALKYPGTFQLKADPARMPFLYLDCGTEDGLLESNRESVALLTKQKIAYEYRERPGAHTWAYCDHQLPEMLSVMMEQMRLGPTR